MPALGTVTIVADFHGRRARREMALTERQLEKLDDEFRDTRGVDRYSRKMRDADRDTNAFRRTLTSLMENVKGFGRLIRFLKWPAMITGARLATTALSALGAQATAAVTSLGPLLGLFIAYPAAGLAMVSTMGMVKLAFMGVGEAASKLADPTTTAEEAAEVLKGLTPAAQDLAKKLAVLRREAVPLFQQAAQEGILPGATAVLESLLKLMPKIIPGMRLLSESIGGIGTRFAGLLGSRGFGDDLSSIFQVNANVVSKLGGALVNVVDAFRHIYLAAGPMLDRMFGLIEAWTAARAESARLGRQSGGLTEFFNDALRIGRGVIQVFSDLGHAFRNISKIGSSWSGEMGESVLNAARGFREWTESADGIQKITSWFERSQPIADAFGRVWVALFKTLKDIAPTGDAVVATLDAVSGPGGLLEQIGLLGQALDENLGVAFVNLASTAVELMTLASAVPIRDIVVSLTEFLGVVIDLVSKLPAGAQEMLAWSIIVGKLTGGLGLLWKIAGGQNLAMLAGAVRGVTAAMFGKTVATNASTTATKAHAAATKVAAAWTAVMRSTLMTFIGVKALEVAAWFKSTAAAVASRVAMVAGTVATWAATAATWALNTALAILTSPITLVIAAIAALAAGVWWAYNNVDWFRAAVDWTWQALQKLWDLITNKVVGAWHWLQETVDNAREGFRVLTTLIRYGFSQAWEWVLGKIEAVTGAIGRAVETVKGAKTAFDEFTSGQRGGVAGRVVSWVNPFGDTARPRAAGGGALGSTLATHAAVESMTPGSRTITNVFKGGFAGSDHHAGRALDLVGPNMNTYRKNLQRLGGFAEHHGSGGGRHLHAAYGDTARPRARAMPVGAGGGSVTTLEVNAPMIGQVIARDEIDIERAVSSGIERWLRERQERR